MIKLMKKCFQSKSLGKKEREKASWSSCDVCPDAKMHLEDKMVTKGGHFPKRRTTYN